jgi:hypothetical protein
LMLVGTSTMHTLQIIIVIIWTVYLINIWLIFLSIWWAFHRRSLLFFRILFSFLNFSLLRKWLHQLRCNTESWIAFLFLFLLDYAFLKLGFDSVENPLRCHQLLRETDLSFAVFDDIKFKKVSLDIVKCSLGLD